jgi:hypothetical protein
LPFAARIRKQTSLCDFSANFSQAVRARIAILSVESKEDSPPLASAE